MFSFSSEFFNFQQIEFFFVVSPKKNIFFARMSNCNMTKPLIKEILFMLQL